MLVFESEHLCFGASCEPQLYDSFPVDGAVQHLYICRSKLLLWVVHDGPKLQAWK